MKRVSLAMLTTVLGLAAITSSCSDSDQKSNNAGSGGTNAGHAGSTSTGGSSAGASPTGGSAGATSAGGSSAGDTASGGASAGTTAAGGVAGDSAAGEGGAGGSSAGANNGGTHAGGAPGTAGEGEPCPDADDCKDGYICVGYGNPLPNGESTACRKKCSVSSPDCNCVGGGWCDGAGGSGGGGGAGGAPNCSVLIPYAPCEDAFADTKDYQSGTFGGCMHWRDLGEGKGWIYYDGYGGFHYDLTTGLAWVMRIKQGAETFTVTQAEAAAFCEEFSISGLDNWRLPTIDESRTLAAGCPETAPSGSCAIDDSACLEFACGTNEDCTSCKWGDGPGKSGEYCRPEAQICGGFHTSSLCSDCATASAWRYASGNGNFYAGALDNKTFPVCVMDNVPNAVPCE